MMDKIAEYIKEEVANEPLTEIDSQEDLLGGGIIDSVGMMKLVLFLENEFDVKIIEFELNFIIWKRKVRHFQST